LTFPFWHSVALLGSLWLMNSSLSIVGSFLFLYFFFFDHLSMIPRMSFSKRISLSGPSS